MDPLVADIMKSLVGLGPGGIVAAWAVYLWRDERTERRKLQDKNSDMLQQTISSRLELASALNRLSDKVSAK